MFDYHRIAAAVPDVRVADVVYNKNKIIEKLDEAGVYGAELIVFPELCVTGYTCGDLFLQSTLLTAAEKAIQDITAISCKYNTIIALGAPIKIGYQLYNTCIIIFNGRVYGIVPKTYIPNYNEFYEKRWFSSASDANFKSIMSSQLGISVNKPYDIPFGNDVIFSINDMITFGAEICEDLWSPVPPSENLAVAGAELIINLSASNETIGKREYRRNLVKSKSAQLMCEYVYVSAGSGESTTDLIFSGHSMFSENGKMIAENDSICDNNYILCMDMDLGKIKSDRLKGKTYKDSAALNQLRDIRVIDIINDNGVGSLGELYIVDPHPFIPGNKTKRISRCRDIFDMQVGGLAKRIGVTRGKLVVGVSGGMDSTLALLVAAQTLKKLGKSSKDLIGITMPAFGTTSRTYTNSLKLMEALDITSVEINIKDACIKHYEDIGHDMDIKDITYENVQARERTQILMDYANKINAIVVGTGDLSELALGWCTYNADQMSMYGVNASIPKTLVKWMIDSVIDYNVFPEATEVLRDIIDTPISPELLPPDENGNIIQKTEDSVGPYELHDFFLYYMLRYGYGVAKIFNLATRAFDGKYDSNEIIKWMKMFYQRFFTQQFKRSCMPDGVKVGSICLSPRGDWRMPSDASYNLWMKDLEELEATL